MEQTIKLAYLYPDILNLHGDRGNVLAFKKVAKEMGLELEIKRIDDLNEKVDFEKYDIVLLSPGELKATESIKDAMNAQIEDFNKFIEDEKYFIVTGTTIAAFGKKIKRENGDVIEGLNVIDMTHDERQWIYGDDLTFTTNVNGTDMEIIATQIASINTVLGDATPFGKVEYGMGNNKSGAEGARKNNLILTNALGPVFIKNPWFTKAILEDIANKKGFEIKNPNPDFSLEKASKETIKDFIAKKTSNEQ